MATKKKKAAAPAPKAHKEKKPEAATAPAEKKAAATGKDANKVLFVGKQHVFKSIFSKSNFFNNQFKKP